MKSLNLCGFLCFWLFTCTAQKPVFRHYTTADGLPSSEVYCSLQDKKGYMWFGTDRGLVKFDGYTFQTFTTADGLPDNTIFILTKDSFNRLWFNTYTNQVGYWFADSFYRPQFYSRLKEVHPSSVMAGMQVEASSGLWVSYPENIGRTTIYHTYIAHSDGKIDSSLFIDSEKNGTFDMYIEAGKKPAFSGKSNAKNIRILGFNKKVHACFPFDGLVKKSPKFTAGQHGDFWINVGDKIINLKDGICRYTLSTRGRLLSMSTDKQDNLWVGYEHGGVTLIYANSNYKNNITFLSSFSISDIRCDLEYGLWFSTLEDGIYYLPPEQLFSFTEDDFHSVSKVMKVHQVDQHLMLILSNQKIAIKSPGISGFYQLKPDPLASINVYYQPPDKIFYSSENKINLPGNKKNILLAGTQKICMGRKTIWAHSFDKIVQYNNEGIPMQEIPLPGLSRITSMAEQPDGSLLIGTLTGLYTYQQQHLIALKNDEPLLGSRISAIERLNSSALVVATIGQGLLLITNNNWKRPLHLTAFNGLPSNMCHAIATEGDSVLWVGTNKGLCRIRHPLHTTARSFSLMNNNNGIVSDEINDICIVGDTIWLGTMKGLTALPKILMSQVPSQIPVHIEKISRLSIYWNF